MLLIVCYLDEDLGLCPVKEYLEQFNIDNQNSAQTSSNLSTLIDISQKIKHVLKTMDRPLRYQRQLVATNISLKYTQPEKTKIT